MIVANEDVKEVLAEIPEGHRHLRTTVTMQDGTVLTFQEATIANLVRAYVTIKTHPRLTRIRLSGKLLDDRKEGYAAWQLIEE